MDASPVGGSAPAATARDEAVRRLGGPGETFRPGAGTLAAGAIIGALPLAAGGSLAAFAAREAVVNGHRLPWFARDGASLAAVLGAVVIGLVLAATGVAMFVAVRGLARLRVVVCPGGLVCGQPDDPVVFPWDQVEGVTCPGDGPEAPGGGFVVRRRDGVECEFDRDTVGRPAALTRLIEEAIGRRPAEPVDRPREEYTPEDFPCPDPTPGGTRHTGAYSVWLDPAPVGDEVAFAVVIPHRTAGLAELTALGERLRGWQEAHDFVRRVTGLDQLLRGECPETPAWDLWLSSPPDNEPVALVYVPPAASTEQTGNGLVEALTGTAVGAVMSPAYYTQINR